MTTDMTKILCTKSHEYLVKESNLLKIGVTDFAVEQLGDVVFIELPEIDSKRSRLLRTCWLCMPDRDCRQRS